MVTRPVIILLAALIVALPDQEENGLEDVKMYGLIGKITATPDQRDALIEILLAGTKDMPGCLSYLVAKDEKDVNAIWVTEVWDSKESHEASLELPAVQQAIARGRPLIAGFGERFVTVPMGGHGLVGSKKMKSSHRDTKQGR